LFLSIFQAVQIEIALLSQKPSGFQKLKELAASEGGLITDDLRRRAWPKLLNIEVVRRDRPICHIHKNVLFEISGANRGLTQA
jgi:hypothetical protein